MVHLLHPQAPTASRSQTNSSVARWAPHSIAGTAHIWRSRACGDRPRVLASVGCGAGGSLGRGGDRVDGLVRAPSGRIAEEQLVGSR